MATELAGVAGGCRGSGSLGGCMVTMAVAAAVAIAEVVRVAVEVEVEMMKGNRAISLPLR